MKIVFKTNLDNYSKMNCFSTNLTFVPRKGEYVQVTKDYIGHYISKRLPMKLEVVSVTYNEDEVICDLWYNNTDLELMKSCDINPF